MINFQEIEKKEEKKEDPDAVAKIPNMDHPQILEPVLHNPDEEDKVPRSDDRNIGKMDNHPQESRGEHDDAGLAQAVEDGANDNAEDKDEKDQDYNDDDDNVYDGKGPQL